MFSVQLSFFSWSLKRPLKKASIRALYWSRLSSYSGIKIGFWLISSALSFSSLFRKTSLKIGLFWVSSLIFSVINSSNFAR
ncbi:hypothetical protein NBX26_00675 [Mesomycoplasma hyopneumoniae]|uniref:Uncharacterized protein n=1 Tax=Mesomycoplasma hyopneumoniae (strain 7448) TaxID=262722 RepID=Q4A8P5_MESH7|nr:hypothetical protein MHP7448_0684 [Mesomycoplasma hyopneumoniae 7448]AGQ50752.1 hypothetical protein MHL_2668 [Mesomycoplasma hyopneumoniae 7422]